MVESAAFAQTNSVDHRSFTMKTTTKCSLKNQAETEPKLKIRAETEPKLKIRAEVGPKLRTWAATGPRLERASHYWSWERRWWR
jgi:hypothetical protein